MGMLDSAGNYGAVGTAWFENGFDTSFRVFRGEDLIVETAWNPALTFPVEPEPTTYRVEFDIDNRADWASLSTQTRGVWTFTSEPSADGTPRVEPLITLDYDLDIDLQNTQPVPNLGEGANEIVLQFGHPPGAEQLMVEDATLEVSYTDGRIWEPVTGLTANGENRFTATVDVPLNRSRSLVGDAVSLRVTGSDSAGNTLEQEVIRAYAIAYVP